MVTTNGNSQLSILQVIRDAGELSRNEIAMRTGYSLSVVSRLTRRLMDERLIQERSKSVRRTGRPFQLISLNPEAGYVIGIGIDSVRVKAVITNLQGNIEASLIEDLVAMETQQDILATIERIIDQVIADAALCRKNVLGLGVSVQSLVHPTTGFLYGWPNGPIWSGAWVDFPLRDALAARLPWPHVFVDDTVRALGIAEAQYGLGVKERNFIYVLADTGMGAAIMLEGRPYIGSTNIAGEIGHITLSDSPIPCVCGNKGCLQVLASVGAILSLVRERLTSAPMMTSISMGSTATTIESIIREAENHDKLAYQVLSDAGDYLGKALVTMLNLLGIDLIIVGGALASSEVYLDAARHRAMLGSLPQVSRTLRIVQGQLGDLADCRGAANLVLNALFTNSRFNLLVSNGYTDKPVASAIEIP